MYHILAMTVAIPQYIAYSVSYTMVFATFATVALSSHPSPHLLDLHLLLDPLQRSDPSSASDPTLGSCPIISSATIQSSQRKRSALGGDQLFYATIQSSQRKRSDPQYIATIRSPQRKQTDPHQLSDLLRPTHGGLICDRSIYRSDPPPRAGPPYTTGIIHGPDQV